MKKPNKIATKYDVFPASLDGSSGKLLCKLLCIHDEAVRPVASSVDRRLDISQPTLSALVKSFDFLMKKSAPDLYKSEWELLRAIELRFYQLVNNSTPSFMDYGPVDVKRSLYITGLEDLPNSGAYKIDPYELSKKLSRFSDVEIMSIAYHLQLTFASATKGEAYAYPEIQTGP